MSLFIGRERETEWLRQRLVGDRGRLLLIAGEAGSGKTRLVREVLEDDRLAIWLSFPSAVFATPGLGLKRLAATKGSEAAALAAELAAPDPQGEARLATICTAADEVVRAKGSGIAVLDGVQWADDLTLTWLARSGGLLETSAATLVLIVRAAGRLPSRVAGALAKPARARRLETLELGPMTVEEVGLMATARGVELDASSVHKLHERTDGLPLAVEELLTRVGPDNVLDDAIEHLAAPSAVVGLLREQLDELDADARELLAAAALAPRPTTERIVRATIGVDPQRFDVALESVLNSGLMTETAGTLTFKHELQREAMEGELPLAHSRALHRQIADVLVAEPETFASEIAHQFIGAGAGDEAVEWLERAAGEALQTHDYGSALNQLASAIELCPASHAASAARIANKAAAVARYSNRPEAGLQVVAVGLERAQTPAQRASLQMSRAALAADIGDNAARLHAHLTAAEEFRDAGDDSGRARALATLAVPTDDALPIGERLELGREGFALAERTGDPLTIAWCGNTLATAELSNGDLRAFDLWAKAERVLEGLAGSSDAARANLYSCRYNWAAGALEYGRYEEAGRVVAEARADSLGRPGWKTSLDVLDALRLWRIGRWDEALIHPEPGSEMLPHDAALVRAIRAAVAFERERRPAVDPIAESAEILIGLGDYGWGSLVLSWLVRARAARREPNAVRGVLAWTERIAASGVRLGWDDILPAVAGADDGQTYKRMVTLIGDLRPVGRRAEAAIKFATGLSPSSDTNVCATLEEAASLYEEIGEPYASAQAYETAASATSGRHRAVLAERSAEAYARVGAHRALRRLLRSVPSRRVLAKFGPPPREERWRLTDREREVVDLARRGYTARAIADALTLSVRTVEKHLERVKDKLGVSRKGDLVRALGDELPDRTR